MRRGEWKLLRTGKKTELYDLGADIGEKHNLAGEEPARVKELEAAYKEWNAANHPAYGPRSGAGGPNEVDPDDKTIGDQPLPDES